MKAIVQQSFSVKHLLVLLISILVYNNTNAQEPYQVRMAMVGNSITFGSTLPNPGNDNYTSQLNNMLTNLYGDTNDILYVDLANLPTEEAVQIKLFDALGEQIIEHSYLNIQPQAKYEIKTASLHPGVYFYGVYVGKESYYGSFVKH